MDLASIAFFNNQLRAPAAGDAGSDDGVDVIDATKQKWVWRYCAWQAFMLVGWLWCIIYVLIAFGRGQLDMNVSWFGPNSGLLRTFKAYNMRYMAFVCIAFTKIPGAVCGFMGAACVSL